MSVRDLIAGTPDCAVPGTSAARNPMGALTNAVLGSSSRAQELKGLPRSSSTGINNEAPLVDVPGFELENQQFQHPGAQSSQFLRGYHSADRGGFAEAWDEVGGAPVAVISQGMQHGAPFAEFDQIYNHGAGAQHGPTWDAPPQRALSRFLHSFVQSSFGHVPFVPVQLPVLGLSKNEKQCIRDRSCIMARHIFADKGEDYIDTQLNALLHSLDIDSDDRMQGPLRGLPPKLEEYWNKSQTAPRKGVVPTADRWVAEFNHQTGGDPGSWADSFERQHGVNGWASEFEKEQTQMSSHGQMGTAKMPSIKQATVFEHTLRQDNNPKFQNSQFLQFISKMSHGELIIDDSQIKSEATPVSGGWANDAHPNSWAERFSQDQLSHGEDSWADDFASERKQDVDNQWVNDFSKLNVQDWAEEFVQEDNSANNWADVYGKYLDEQLVEKHGNKTSKRAYVFSDMNPYVGHPHPLKEGQELFHKGLLSEAVLALEAEVMKNPNNCEGWRLLGITHAENDDDQQAIAAMIQAQEADPANLEVLLALGVSHTNELEQAEALKYLYGWLQNHPKYGSLASPQLSESLYHSDVARLFNEASAMSPEDADVHIVLGVLYNLSREYDKAMASFRKALKLKPQDYSLWNKLGATQANSIQSADAILAYQHALDLKPNYVRAWANMGISYANRGLFEDSIRYYVRALIMNPKADTAWRSLRISLSGASRNDMVEACDSRNIDLLQREFPL